MKKSFFKHSMCKKRIVCKQCRSDESYRKQLSEKYYVGENVCVDGSCDFECPHGITSETMEGDSIVGMAKSLGKAVGGTILSKAKGSDTWSKHPELKLEICLSCPYLHANGSNCSLCKCNVRAKVKLLDRNSPCPIGRWRSILGSVENL